MGNTTDKFKSEIDLVAAAQIEYDFLRLIDNHPTLFTLPVLQNALYRYEKYWLPLCCDHKTEKLIAPLDIEWVWHCHILNPIKYGIDSQTLLGMVIDHQPYKYSDDAISLSKRYWEEKFPDIPFEVDLKVDNPPLLDEKYNKKSSYDIVSAAQRQRIFNYNTSLPHYRDPKFLKHAVKRYKIMLEIKKKHPRTFIVPCYDNDLIWHTHQQHVGIYMSDTTDIFGSIFDHDDSTNDRSPGSHLEKSTLETKQLWRDLGHDFGVPGAMYRGDPPIHTFGWDMGNYSYTEFNINDITRQMLYTDHIGKVLRHIALIAPESKSNLQVPCEYKDSVLRSGARAFVWRVVHCKMLQLSAIEVVDADGNVVATAYTIDDKACPTANQVSDTTRCYTHDPAVERSILIRGKNKDWGILRSSWINFKRGKDHGELKSQLFLLKSGDWKDIELANVDRREEYRCIFGYSDVWLAIKMDEGVIKMHNNALTKNEVEDVAELLALSGAIALSIVLVQPRPSPSRDGNLMRPYPEVHYSKAKEKIDVDKMKLCIATGLYSTTLPRSYHTKSRGATFYQKAKKKEKVNSWENLHVYFEDDYEDDTDDEHSYPNTITWEVDHSCKEKSNGRKECNQEVDTREISEHQSSEGDTSQEFTEYPNPYITVAEIIHDSATNAGGSGGENSGSRGGRDSGSGGYSGGGTYTSGSGARVYGSHEDDGNTGDSGGGGGGYSSYSGGHSSYSGGGGGGCGSSCGGGGGCGSSCGGGGGDDD